MTDVVAFKKPSRKGRPAGLRQKSPPKESPEEVEKSSVANVKDRRSAVQAKVESHKQGVARKRNRDAAPGDEDEESGGGVVDVAWSATNSSDNTMNRNTAVVDTDAETIDGPRLKKYKEGDEVDADDLEDDGLYKGLQSYTTHIKKKPDSAQSDKFKAGPVRAPTNIRQITITDFQPDVCKDYKETGWCGYGDTCKVGTVFHTWLKLTPFSSCTIVQTTWQDGNSTRLGTKCKRKSRGLQRLRMRATIAKMRICHLRA